MRSTDEITRRFFELQRWENALDTGVAKGISRGLLRELGKPDTRIGFVKAEYKSPAGLIKSHWRYESTQMDWGMKWVWDFTIPEGATADVTLPGETASKRYSAGTYHIVKPL